MTQFPYTPVLHVENYLWTINISVFDNTLKYCEIKEKYGVLMWGFIRKKDISSMHDSALLF